MTDERGSEPVNHARTSRHTDAAPADGDGLRAHVADAVDVITVLEAQVADAVDHVERAVVDVCGTFEHIAEEARALVTMSAAHVGDRGGVEETLTSARRTFEVLLDRVERGCKLSEAAVERMRVVDDSMKQVMRTVRRVEQIAASTRLLALNATIEAARSGRHGRGFAVVASEITKLANQSKATSRDIAEGMEKVGADIRATATSLREIAEADRREAQASRGEITTTLDALRDADGALRELVVRSGAGSEAVARDVARAVQRLQFQDVMSQRLGHVMRALRDIGAALGPLVADTPRGGGALADLARTYTMAAERVIQAVRLGHDAHGGGAEGHVELF